MVCRSISVFLIKLRTGIFENNRELLAGKEMSRTTTVQLTIAFSLDNEEGRNSNLYLLPIVAECVNGSMFNQCICNRSDMVIMSCL